MNFDTLLANWVVLLLIAMTVYGGILAVPPKSKPWSSFHRWIFVAFGVVTAGCMVWQNYRSDAAKALLENQSKLENENLKNEISGLKAQVEQENVQERADAARRALLRDRLGQILASGEKFSNRCSGGLLTPACEVEWKRWKDTVRDFLRDNLGLAFVARFDSAEIAGFPPYETIGGELAEIKKILQELND